MKNILSRFTGIFALFHTSLPVQPVRRESEVKQQEEAVQAPSSWERLIVLLDMQSQTGTMDVGEARQISRLIKQEDLDMVLREFRSVKGSALSRLNLEDDLGDG